MGRTMDIEDALAEAKEEIAALRREKEQHKSEMQSGYGDRTNARMASAGGGDMAALKRSLDSDWDLSEAESKAAMMDRRLLSTGRNPDAYKMHEAQSIARRRGTVELARALQAPLSAEELAMTPEMGPYEPSKIGKALNWATMTPEMGPYEPSKIGKALNWATMTPEMGSYEPNMMNESRPARRIGQPSAGRSAVLGEYRSDPAWEAGFQSVLMNRDSYGLSELDGSALRADGAREGVLVSRGDTDSLNDLGRSEALEFLEREAKKIDRQSLIEGMQ